MIEQFGNQADGPGDGIPRYWGTVFRARVSYVLKISLDRKKESVTAASERSYQ